MTTRRWRQLLSLTTVALVLAAAGVVAWALFSPVPRGLDPEWVLDVAGERSSDRQGAPLPPARDALLTRAQQPIRQQLFDPPPPPPPPEEPPPPLPGIELISTVLPSGGEPSAWVREPADGNTPRKVRIGDTLGPTDNPAVVTEIEPDRLLVEHDGEIKPIERGTTSSGRRR